MGSTPSKQKDTIFAKPRVAPFQNMGAVVCDGELGMGEEDVAMGRVAPTQKDAASASGSESLIRKHQTESQGTRVSWPVTARTPEEVQLNGGCKNEEPNTQAQSASIKEAGHFKANH